MTAEKTIKRVTWIGMLINFALSGGKLAGGLFSGSQALIADAVHSLSDWASDLVIIVGVRMWSAPPDEQHPYGHARIETVISLVIGLLLLSVGGGLIYNSFESIQAGDVKIRGGIVVWVAVVSMVSKEFLYQWSVRVGKRVKSSALIANAWHHRSDALSSLPVALAAIGHMIWPGLKYLDAIAAIIVAVFIFQAARKIIMPALRELVDAGVSNQKREEIVALVKTCEGVESLHKLRTRRVGSGVQVDLHLQVDGALSVTVGHEIATYVQHRLLNECEDVIDVLIHIEPYECEPVTE